VRVRERPAQPVSEAKVELGQPRELALDPQMRSCTMDTGRGPSPFARAISIGRSLELGNTSVALFFDDSTRSAKRQLSAHREYP